MIAHIVFIKPLSSRWVRYGVVINGKYTTREFFVGDHNSFI